LTIVRDAQAQDAYVDKLAKILPAELTATYFLIRTLAGQAPHLTPYLLLMALALCAVFYVIAPKLINMTLPLNRLLYCLTFVTWFLAIDPARFGADLFLLNEQQISIFVFVASGIAAIWSFAVPHLLQMPAPPPPPAPPSPPSP
jgi:hypothetical protein